MPNVAGKKFPYTAKGKAAAKKAVAKKGPAPMPTGKGGDTTTPRPKGLAKPATRGAVRTPKAIVQKPARKGEQLGRAKLIKPARKK